MDCLDIKVKNMKERENKKGKGKEGKGYLVIMFLVAFALSGIASGELAYADTPTRAIDGIAVTGATVSISAGARSNNLVPLDIQNVSSSQGATVHIKGQENVTTIAVYLNGTLCQAQATVGLWDAYPFDCDSAINTTILAGLANISIHNNGSNPIKLGAIMSVRYREDRAGAVDISTLATKDQLNSNTSTILSSISTANISVHGALSTNFTALSTEVNASRDFASAANSTAFEINTTINSQTWKDSIATRVWAATVRTLTSIAQSIIQLA